MNSDVTLFWHVAAFNHWREVVVEQARYLARKDFSGKLVVGFVGGAWEDLFVRKTLDAVGLDYILHCSGSDFNQFEYPTLCLLQSHCNANPAALVGYFHTKSVSQPNVWHSLMWRWAMNVEVLGCSDMAGSLTNVDVAGYSWTLANELGNQHFRGNFWLARAAYIRRLPDPWVFRDQTWHRHRPAAMPDRFPAEMWIGADAGVLANDLCTVPGHQPGKDSFACGHDFWVNHPEHEAHYLKEMLG